MTTGIVDTAPLKDKKAPYLTSLRPGVERYWVYVDETSYTLQESTHEPQQAGVIGGALYGWAHCGWTTVGTIVGGSNGQTVNVSAITSNITCAKHESSHPEFKIAAALKEAPVSQNLHSSDVNSPADIGAGMISSAQVHTVAAAVFGSMRSLTPKERRYFAQIYRRAYKPR